MTPIVETIPNDTNSDPMKMMMEISTQVVGFLRYMALSRQSVQTADGIIFLNANATPRGTKIR
jgi:hypothetical protein